MSTRGRGGRPGGFSRGRGRGGGRGRGRGGRGRGRGRRSDKGYTEFQHYMYSSNQNIALVAKHRARVDGPTGEPESLRGRDLGRMGTLAQRRTAPTRTVRLHHPQPHATTRTRTGSRTGGRTARSVLNIATTTSTHPDTMSSSTSSTSSSFIYVPTTSSTRTAYASFLSLLSSKMGGIPSSVLIELADEILTLLRKQKGKGKATGGDRKRMIGMLGSLMGLGRSGGSGGGEGGESGVGAEGDVEEVVGELEKWSSQLIDWESVKSGSRSRTDDDQQQQQMDMDVDEEEIEHEDRGLSLVWDEDEDEDLVEEEEDDQQMDDEGNGKGKRRRRGGRGGRDAVDAAHGDIVESGKGLSFVVVEKEDPGEWDVEGGVEASMDHVVVATGIGMDVASPPSSSTVILNPMEHVMGRIVTLLENASSGIASASPSASGPTPVSTHPPESIRSLARILLDMDKTDHDCENEIAELLEYDLVATEALIRNRNHVCDLVVKQQEQDGSQPQQEQQGEQEEEEGEVVDGDLSSRRRRHPKQQQQQRRRLRGGVDQDGDIEMLDLKSMAFDRSSHLMTNTSCSLPESTRRNEYKGYEEIHIPAPPKPEMMEDERLIPIPELPAWVQLAFPDYMKELNRMQSIVFPAAFQRKGNLLVCAPTGAGKTNIAVLTILEEMRQHVITRGENAEFDGWEDTSFKIVYVAPMKALVQEVVGKLRGRFWDTYGIRVGELTGDSTMTRHQIDQTQIIVCTPEKWDIVTRKMEDRTFVENVRVLIIDEIHLLHDDRGPVLEAIIARTLRHKAKTNQPLRLVGISATLPNYVDVARFCEVGQDGLFHFGNEFRPVPLDQFYIGIKERKTLKKLQLMNEICFKKVIERAEQDLQMIIFVHSRKETGKTAKFILEMGQRDGSIERLLEGKKASRQILQEVAEGEIKNLELKGLLPHGLGIHHAGMLREDRTLVEDLFARKHLRVLCSTATLAWGVNLPAHTVLIKGTQVYMPELGQWTELSALDILQMMGRAGRPGFDSEGEGIVMTSHSELLYYLSLLNQQLPIESQMIKKLPEHLNAEVVLGNIGGFEDAVDWLRHSYLFVRMLQNPELYGISNLAQDPNLLTRRKELVHSASMLLHRHGLVVYDRRTGDLQPTEIGRIASHFYLPHESISTYNKHLRPQLTEIDIFRVFCLSHEFRFMVVRQEEKVELQKMYERVPIPIREPFDDPLAKTSVLLQCFISRLTLQCFSLVSDLTYVTQSAIRILRALFEIALRKRWSGLARRLHSVALMVERRMWVSQSPLRQFPRVSSRIVLQLERKDITWDRLSDLTVGQLSELIRYETKGRDIYKKIHQFPRLEVSAEIQPIAWDVYKFDMMIQADFQYIEAIHGPGQLFHIIVEDTNQDRILHHEYFLLQKRYATETHIVSFTIPATRPRLPVLFVRVLSDRWIGSEVVLPVFLSNVFLPKRVRDLATPFVDVRPVPILDALGGVGAGRVADAFPMKVFNQIQSQVFPEAFLSDSDLVLCGRGRTGIIACAELAMMKALVASQESRVVYISPFDHKLKLLTEEWTSRFQEGLGLRVAYLTGDLLFDKSLIQSSRIIVASPSHWDLFSRKWRVEKRGRGSEMSFRGLMESIRLVVADDLHMIGSGDRGHILEIVVSRMCFISKLFRRQGQVQEEGAPSVRILGLALPVACPQDLSSWIGAKKFFNFAPRLKPIIHPFSGNVSFTARLLSMIRKSSTMLRETNLGSCQLVIMAPSPSSINRSISELAAMLRGSVQLVFANPEEFEAKYVSFVEDEFLQGALRLGLPYYHDGLSLADRQIVKDAYLKKFVRVLFVPSALVWKASVLSWLGCERGIILGTEYYSGQEHRYAHYSVVEIVQMMSIVRDRVALFTTDSKQSYYHKFLVSHPFLPVESQLDHFFADHLNAEIAAGLVESPQNAMDYLLNSFLFRRLRKNPNYYNLSGTDSDHVQEFLSQLVETTAQDLVSTKCIEQNEDDMTFGVLNLGVIGAECYVSFSSMDLFDSSATESTKLRGILEILSAASEFDSLPLRRGEDAYLEYLSRYAPLKLAPGQKFTEPQTKANLVLQAYFSRTSLEMPLMSDDQELILKRSPDLIKALMNVISKNGWLKPAVSCVELSQMIVQGVWDHDSYLKQIPHFSPELVKELGTRDVETVFDVIEMDESERGELFRQFGIEEKSRGAIANLLNNYPDVDVVHSIDSVSPEGEVSMTVELQLEEEEVDISFLAQSGRFPRRKEVEWWLLVGSSIQNALFQMRLVRRLVRTRRLKFRFQLPTEVKKHQLVLFLLCDSYTGCDQEHKFEVVIPPSQA